MTIGQAILLNLRIRDLTQAWLARQLGVDKAAVTRWKQGVPMPPHHVTRACEVLGLAPDALKSHTPPSTVPTEPRDAAE